MVALPVDGKPGSRHAPAQEMIDATSVPVPLDVMRGTEAKRGKSTMPTQKIEMTGADTTARPWPSTPDAGSSARPSASSASKTSVSRTTRAGRAHEEVPTRALVDTAVEATGTAWRRSRLLPARLVVYCALALTLSSGSGDEQVMRSLVEGPRGRGPGRH